MRTYTQRGKEENCDDDAAGDQAIWLCWLDQARQQGPLGLEHVREYAAGVDSEL